MERESERRVLIVWGSWGPYHHARFAAARTQLAAAGWLLEGVQMYSASGIYPWASTTTEGVHDIGLAPPEMRFYPILTLRRVLRLLLDRRPAVVLVPSYWHWSLVINACSRVLGARTVMMNDTHAATTRGGGLRMAFKTVVVRRFAAALVAGHLQREFFERLGLDGSKIFTGYDVVDNAHFADAAGSARGRRLDRTAHHGLPDRYLLSLGRLVAKKNLALVLEAYALLTVRMGERTPALVVVGEGDELPSLMTQSAVLGLGVVNWHRHAAGENAEASAQAGFVHFRPYADYNETPEVMGLATAFMLASTSEEWGLVINEAMSSGTCVVVSDAVGCVPDLCLDGETALVFPSGDAKALATVLERVSTDEPMRQRVAAGGRRHIDAWGLDRFAEGCLRAVDAAVSR